MTRVQLNEQNQHEIIHFHWKIYQKKRKKRTSIDFQIY